MRLSIALLAPTYWPEVRRGSERIVHDLGLALSERGHEVTLLTTHPGPRQVSVEDGIRVDRARRPPQIGVLRWYEPFVGNAPLAAWRLLEGDFDVAHCFFPAEAYGAALARSYGGPRFVATIHGIPDRRYLVARRYRLEMLQRIVASASALTVLSEAAAAPLRRYLLAEPEIVPGGVRCLDFEVDAPREAQPTLICAASLADPRKRAPLLLEAFELLRERVPEARLWLAGGADLPYLGEGAPAALPAGVERVPADATAALADRYARAWASVLPSVDEAFGLVIVESLAAGTPAVGARSGAVGELLAVEGIGAQFEPDDAADLARAMEAGLELAKDPGTAQRCRERAAEFDWPLLAGRVEKIYDRVLAA